MATISRLGLAGFAALVVLSGVAAAAGIRKVLFIAWVAFGALAGAALLGERSGRNTDPDGLVWSYGLASGAMITSAAVFLLPAAVDHHAEFGGFGVALGVLVGFASHTVGHRATHLDVRMNHTVTELTAHSLAAGSIIGLVYANQPEIGLLLGVAIVSHKGPAGYVAAYRLRRANEGVSVLLLPASGVGITAIPAGLLELPNAPALNGVVFGFAAGVFLHLAMDFLPRCEVGGEVYDVANVTGDDHELLDRLRTRAVASTALGAFAVFLAWTVA